jgi:hypothetical protein
VVFAAGKGSWELFLIALKYTITQAKIIKKTESGKATIVTLFPTDRLPYAFFGIVNQSTGLLPGKHKMLWVSLTLT